MPVAVAGVLVNAFHDGLDGMDLVGAHHHQLLLAGYQHHVAADHFAEGAFGEELFGKAVEMGDFFVVFCGELVERKKTLVGVEAEVAAVVVDEVPGIGAVADDEELQEAEQCFNVAVAVVVFVLDNLLHGAARADGEGFQLDLNHRHAVDEEQEVVAVMAVIGVDAELVNDLEAVFAPLPDVDLCLEEWCAVVAVEAVAFAQMAGGRENVGGDNLIDQSGKLGIGQLYPVKRFEFLTEVLFQCVPVTDVGAVAVFDILEFFDQALLGLVFCCHA